MTCHAIYQRLLAVLFAIALAAASWAATTAEVESQGLPAIGFTAAAAVQETLWLGTEVDGPDGQSYVYRSQDNGATWSRFGLEVDEAVARIEFVDASLGFLMMRNHVFRTSDGGDSWTQLDLGPRGPGSAIDLFALDEARVLALFASDFYRTSDGGSAWETFPSFPSAQSIVFASQQVAYLSGHSYLYKSTDRGEVFNLLNVPIFQTEALTDMVFFDENRGFVAGSLGNVYGTSNGGETWARRQVASGDASSTRIAFPTATNGFLVFDEQLYETTDGGLAWDQVEGFESARLVDVATSFATAVVADIDGSVGIIDKSLDFWRRVYPGLPSGRRTAFSDSERGMALREDSYANGDRLLMVTDNGGALWKREALPDQSERLLYDFHLFDDGTGYVVGGGRSLWTKEAENESWERSDLAIDAELRRIYFLNAETGWALDVEHRLHRTDNGGVTWTYLQDHDAFGEIRFFDSENGWFFEQAWFNQSDGKTVVESQRVWRTVDGGDSWIDVTPELEGSINAIEWGGPNTVLLNDISPKTIDGALAVTVQLVSSRNAGRSWTRHDTPFDLFVSRYQFASDCLAYAFGDGVWESRDGGRNWRVVEEAVDFATPVQSVEAVSDETLMVVDADGVTHRVTMTREEAQLVGVFEASVDAGDPFSIAFASEVGGTYVFETSADLAHWERRCDRVVATDTRTEWTDDQLSGEGFAEALPRFYRVYEVIEASDTE